MAETGHVTTEDIDDEVVDAPDGAALGVPNKKAEAALGFDKVAAASETAVASGGAALGVSGSDSGGTAFLAAAGPVIPVIVCLAGGALVLFAFYKCLKVGLQHQKDMTVIKQIKEITEQFKDYSPEQMKAFGEFTSKIL